MALQEFKAQDSIVASLAAGGGLQLTHEQAQATCPTRDERLCVKTLRSS